MSGQQQNSANNRYHSQLNFGNNVANFHQNDNISNMNINTSDASSQLPPPNGQVYNLNQDQHPQDLHNVFENCWAFPSYHQSHYQPQLPYSVQSFNSNLPTDSKLILDTSLVEGKSAKNLYSEEASLDTPSSTASPTYIYRKNSEHDMQNTTNEFKKHKVPLPKPPKTKPRTEIVKTDDGRIKIKVKRSRMGCLTCRQRKKRCCETKPNCYECRRLSLNCMWPSPGFEHKNRPKHGRNENEGMHYDPFFGNIKILRGIVES